MSCSFTSKFWAGKVFLPMTTLNTPDLDCACPDLRLLASGLLRPLQRTFAHLVVWWIPLVPPGTFAKQGQVLRNRKCNIISISLPNCHFNIMGCMINRKTEWGIYVLGFLILPCGKEKYSAQHFILEGAILLCHNKFKVNLI